MYAAFTGKILRVDLSSGEVHPEDLREDWLRQFIGGAGLATQYLYQETPPGIDPYGPHNRLIFMTGPLTGIWGHANSGGSFGPALKKSGYDGLIFEGIAPEPVYLLIQNGEAKLCQATDLWSMTVSETEDYLLENVDSKLTIASIGPAGENLVRYAAIMNNKHRAAGRCGLGAVMGVKRLKAIACGGNTPLSLANPPAFYEHARRQIELLDESMLKVGFEAFGTNVVSDMVNIRGGYPTRNWQEGVFDQIDEVNAQALTDKVFVEGTHCFACPISCGRGSAIRDGKWQGQYGEGPEYETANMFGALCGVSDMNAITMANYLCNDYGLDTISAGSTIAFAIECHQSGLLSADQSDGIALNFGDADLVVDLIPKIARLEGIGELLAEGTRRMADVLGQGSDRFAMQVKGLDLPAYDPRAAKITGLGYVTANRGGDHITGYIQLPTFIDMPFLIVEESSIRDPFVADPREVQVLVDLENALSMFDATGGCKFMGIQLTAEDIVNLIASATGWEFSVDEFRTSGERIYNLARVYCVREGITRKQDILPTRLMEDPLPDGPAQGMLNERQSLEAMKDAYYQFRGWDIETGIPTPEKLRQLGLEDLVADIWSF